MSATTESAVEVRSLSHSFSEAGRLKPILQNIDFDVPQQSTLALLGQSGSGKSTLLNLISGLEPIQAGRVSILGQQIEQLNDQQRTLLRRQDIGFVYQSFNLVPTLTVGENIALPLTLVATPPRTVQLKVTDFLAQIDLSDRHSAFPDKLSGGEQQRVAIARALIHSPRLLLADEPTGNLDADTGRRILDLLFTTTTKNKGTLILVTHSREVADRADDRMMLRNGSVESADDSSAW